MNESLAASPSTEPLHWVHALRSLARQAGCESTLLPVLHTLTTPGTDHLSVVTIGAPNTGKSALINALLNRKLLPSSPIPSERSVTISATEGEEAFVTPDRGPRPLGELARALSDENPSSVEIQLRDGWLSAAGVELVEARALETTSIDGAQIDDRTTGDRNTGGGPWEQADVVVVVISALMPVRRSEALLLRECADRGLPIIVAVTRMDELSDEDRTAALAHIRTHVAAISPDVRVLEIGRGGDGAAGMRDEVLRVIEHTDFERVRQERLRHALLPLLRSIQGVAEHHRVASGVAETAADDARREQEDHRALESSAWLELEAALHERRSRLEQDARKRLDDAESAIIATLTATLHQSDDVKGWWRDELPHRLTYELRRTAENLATLAEQRIAADVRWLTEEVTRRFQWTVPRPVTGRAEISAPPVRELDEPPLSDAYHFKVGSMVGTSAGVIAAAVFFGATGGGVAVAVASVVGGGLTEIYRRRATKADRLKAAEAIRDIVKAAIHAYLGQAATRLRAGYDAVLGALKEGRLGWQLAQQIQSPVTGEDGAGGPDWESIVHQLDTLAAELARAPSAPAAHR